jgi:hypothetical protein
VIGRSDVVYEMVPLSLTRRDHFLRVHRAVVGPGSLNKPILCCWRVRGRALAAPETRASHTLQTRRIEVPGRAISQCYILGTAADVSSPSASQGFIARTDAQRAAGFIRLGCSFNI